MNVALFGGLDTDVAYSMRTYATALYGALQKRYNDRYVFRLHDGSGIRLPLFLGRSRRLMALVNEGPARLWRYPRAARGVAAEVNHILDHSYGCLLGVLPPKRTVVTCHDLIPLRMPETHPTLYSRLTGWRWYVRNVSLLPHAARVIAISENTKEDLVSLLGCDPQRVVVIPHGIDERFRPDRTMTREAVLHSLGLPAGSRLILHVGNCAPYKNLSGLLATFARIRQKTRETVYLVRVGPPFTAEQQRVVERLGLVNWVVRREQLSISELVALYNAADVFLFPSRYEGLGLPVAEAMACGLPVVASNAASLPEVLGDGQFAFDPDDSEGMANAVVALLENDALRRERIARGLEQVKRFTWERVAEQVLALYGQVWKEAAHA